MLLSWDYWELERRMAEGGGPIAELPTIPKQFATVEVGGLGCCISGQQRLWLACMCVEVGWAGLSCAVLRLA